MFAKAAQDAVPNLRGCYIAGNLYGVTQVRLTRVSLTGFKSFVEEASLEIGPGMTGVVGPNGCGKSNVVEAIRWAMGEHTPRSVRAAEMDDVIFDGSAARPARNLAEIRIDVDNESRSAPPAFNHSDTIEICRRIRRGQGSSYFVNRQEVRARDVQLLFADSALGARSHAIVAQGQVAAIIHAKPADRRRLLEEAAGIVGVHARRHEAELRMRSTEENVARVDDLLETQQSRLAALRRQARQAARYRSLSDRLRTAEARLSLRRWNAARDEDRAARSQLATADREASAAAAAAAAESSRQSALHDQQSQLQAAETEAAAAVQRIAHELTLLNRERDDLADRRRQLSVERDQTSNDLARAQEHLEDIAREQAVLREEQAAIETETQDTAETRRTLESELAAAKAVLAAAQEAETEADRASARAESRVTARAQDLDEKAGALDRLARRIESVEAALDDLATGKPAPFGTLDALAAAVRDADSHGDAADAAEAGTRRRLADAERTAGTAAASLEAERSRLLAADRRLDPLRAERSALAKQLEAGGKNTLARQVRIEPGFERAAAAALGEDLDADPDGGPIAWHDLGDAADSNLPVGSVPLSQFVSGPPALRRRLAYTGVIDPDAGDLRQRDLAPGQRLVDRTGSLWRWDGYAHSSGDATPVSRRFQQKNRFEQLAREIAAAEQDRSRAQARLRTAEDRTRAARTAAAAARQAANRAIDARRQAERKRKIARDRHATALAASVEVRAKHASLSEEHARLIEERSVHRQLLEDARAAADDSEAEPLAQAARERRQETGAALDRFNELLETHTRMREAETHRDQRLATVRQQGQNWVRRQTATELHLEELRRRLGEIENQLNAVDRKPRKIRERLTAVAEHMEAAERRQQSATDARVAGEAGLRDANHAVAAANRRLAEAREAKVRADGVCGQAEDRLGRERERMRERLGAAPEQLSELAVLKPEEELLSREQLERTLERLVRERDSVGPVNLRAEAEAEEAAAEIDKLAEGRAELIQAIDKLRTATNRLNREARERLRRTFETVDHHFQGVFRSLFQGGEARLELVDSDDPLEAGLEIVARPPGKQLQRISLLSGGEKALTSLALIFGMFRTRSGPLCVLDEVDAALDDANVERFCAMLAEIANTSDTRLVVVTHHPFTMTQMDRLYGVTMQEPGVSTLVSVDLARAEGLREAS